MAINPNQPYSATNNGQPVINPQQLAEQYGWAYSFLSSEPELNSLFQEAVAQSWDATRFQAAVEASSWYKQNSAAMRQAQTQKVIDPATYNQQVATEKATILEQASSMGAAISDGLATTIATQQITYGWNADQVNSALSKYVKLNASGAFGGQAGQNAMAISELAYNNGVSLDPHTMQNFLENIAGGKSSVEDLMGLVRQQAIGKYPALQKAIEGGQSVAELASPYTSTMQNMLEVGPGQANLTNPLIQQAMNGLDSAGAPTGMNMADFNNLLRSQPQWSQTQNAQNSAMSVAKNILQSFGFS